MDTTATTTHAKDRQRGIVPTETDTANGQEKNLTNLVREWVENNRPYNTKRSYKTYREQFHSWCAERGYQSMPASPITVAGFMKWCTTDRKLAKSTITRNITAAIADEHRRNNLPSPTTEPIVRAVKQTVRRVGKAGPGGKQPLTAEQVAEITGTYHGISGNEKDEFDWALQNALITIMFAGCLRADEARNLRKKDISIDIIDEKKREAVMYLLIEKSKTDQERIGDTVFIGSADNRYYGACPYY